VRIHLVARVRAGLSERRGSGLPNQLGGFDSRVLLQSSNASGDSQPIRLPAKIPGSEPGEGGSTPSLAAKFDGDVRKAASLLCKQGSRGRYPASPPISRRCRLPARIPGLHPGGGGSAPPSATKLHGGVASTARRRSRKPMRGEEPCASSTLASSANLEGCAER
jgi:hypothetical protein